VREKPGTRKIFPASESVRRSYRKIYIDIAEFIGRLDAINRSESGIGRFSRELRLVLRPVVASVNGEEKKENPTIYQPVQTKSPLSRFLEDP
jgi:hypothetical protein